jgi:hypothetical protein
MASLGADKDEVRRRLAIQRHHAAGDALGALRNNGRCRVGYHERSMAQNPFDAHAPELSENCTFST